MHLLVILSKKTRRPARPVGPLHKPPRPTNHHYRQGDGKLFLGLHVENGRIRDFDNGMRLKTAVRALVDKYKCVVFGGGCWVLCVCHLGC